MRVLFVTSYYEPAWVYGGPTKSVAAWARALAAAGLDIDVFTTAANGHSELAIPLSRPILRDGIRVTYFPRLHASGNRFFSPLLASACFQHAADYDVLHTVGLWTFPSAVGSWAAYRRHVPCVISTQGALMPWAYNRHALRKRLFMALFERRRLAHAVCGICTSSLELDSVLRSGFFRRVEVIPNIVEAPNHLADRECTSLRRRLGLEDALVFLFTGRLVKNKGIDLTVAAFLRVCQNHPRARLVIAGPDEDETGRRLRLQVDQQGVSDRVLFTGMLSGDDYWDAVASADVFVLNSYSENFAMSVAEALAMGRPVLISDRVGIADYVDQYHAGIVTTLDVDRIADAMMLLMSRRHESLEMGRRGMRLAREVFSPSAVGQRFAGVLRDAARQAANGDSR